MSRRIDNPRSFEASIGAELAIPVEPAPGFSRSISRFLSYAWGELLAVVVALGLLLLLWHMMGDMVRDPENLAGTDTYWHVTLADEALDRFRSGQPIGPVSETINAGTPYLYDTGATYPQFTYWSLVGASLVFGSTTLAFAVMMFAAMSVAQLSFFFGFRNRFGIIAAALGAIAFGYGPFLLTNVGLQGRFPAVLAISFIPFVMSAILNVIERPTKRWWILGLIATTLSVSFHPMVFYIAVLGIAIVAGLFVVSARISYKRVLLANAMIVLGIFTAWLFLPTALSSLSFGVTAVSSVAAGDAGIRASTGFDSNIVPFSIRWNSFDVELREINENYAGLGLVLAALIVPFLVWRRSVVLFTLSAAALFVLATGSLTPLWEMLPLASSLEPRRFLFPGYLVIALAISAAVAVLLNQIRQDPRFKVKFRATLGIILISALIAFDIFPMSALLAPSSRTVEKSWIEPAAQTADGGRMFWNAIRDFAPYYFVGRELGIATNGRIADVDLATRQGFPETALQELALMDTRSLLTDSAGFQPLVDVFKAEGFVPQYKRATQEILTSDRPSTRVMVSSRKVGLLGSAARAYWSRIVPNSIEIELTADSPPPYLDTFAAIVISGGFGIDPLQLEPALLRFADDGGLIFIGEPSRARNEWLGIEGSERVVPGVLTIGSGEDAFNTRRFSIGGGDFVGTFYDDAGETVLQGVDEEGNGVPIIQKRVHGKGAIYWVCCHLGNHTVVNPGRDFPLAYTLRSFIEDEIGGYGDIWPESFGDNIEILDPSDISFEYEIDEPQLVVISSRRLPQRRVLIDDGIPLKTIGYGNVFAIVAPAGKHRVLVTTEATAVKVSVLLFWIVGLAVTAFLLRYWWGRLSSPALPVTGILPALYRWIFEPPFALEFVVGGGKLRVCEPMIGDKFDVKWFDGNYWRIQPSLADRSIAIVLLELSASDDEPLEFDFAGLKLVDSGDAEFSVVPTAVMRTTELLFPNLFHLIDIKHTLLRSTLSLAPGQTVRGYVVFEFSTAQEYPFVHNNFVKIQ